MPLVKGSRRQIALFLLYVAAVSLLHYFFGRLPAPWELRSTVRPIPQKEQWIVLDKSQHQDPKPIVKTEKNERQDDTESETRFGGEFRNRVKKEQRAQTLGKFKNRERIAGQPRPPQDREGLAPNRPLGMSDLLGNEQSSQPYKLPDDIATGSQTILNTDPVQYASFVNRISDEIYAPWVRFVRLAVDDFQNGGGKLSENLYVTKLLVTMNGDGQITSIQTLKSCGVFEIDEASKRAFWSAEPFPNPPISDPEKDNSLSLAFEFHLEWKASLFGITPWGV